MCSRGRSGERAVVVVIRRELGGEKVGGEAMIGNSRVITLSFSNTVDDRFRSEIHSLGKHGVAWRGLAGWLGNTDLDEDKKLRQ